MSALYLSTDAYYLYIIRSLILDYELSTLYGLTAANYFFAIYETGLFAATFPLLVRLLFFPPASFAPGALSVIAPRPSGTGATAICCRSSSPAAVAVAICLPRRTPSFTAVEDAPLLFLLLDLVLAAVFALAVSLVAVCRSW